MCDQQTETEVLSVVQDCLSRGEGFSAFDVTKSVRAKGVVARHGDMKTVVHEAFETGRMGDWERTLVLFPNALVKAFLYHPSGYDVDTHMNGEYSKRNMTYGGAPAAAPHRVQAVAAKQPSQPAGQSAIGTGVVRDCGTQCLYVPRSMARAIGIDPSGDAYMAVAGRSVTISSRPSDGDKVHVDRNQNIRVPNSALLRAGLNGSVRVEINGDKITVGSPIKSN